MDANLSFTTPPKLTENHRFSFNFGGVVNDKFPIHNILSIPWTILHLIEENSPLYGMSLEDLIASEVTFLALISGVDVMFNNTIHADKRWNLEDLVIDGQFEDMMSIQKDTRIYDYSKFNNLKEQEEELLYS